MKHYLHIIDGELKDLLFEMDEYGKEMLNEFLRKKTMEETKKLNQK